MLLLSICKDAVYSYFCYLSSIGLLFAFLLFANLLLGSTAINLLIINNKSTD